MRLLAFERLPEESEFTEAPVSYCLVALRHEARVLLVHDRGRGCWELPGGGIEPGETPRAAAARELREETGQSISPAALRFAGFAKTAFRDKPVMRGALFHAEAATVTPFTPNDEITAVTWWTTGDPPPPGGPLQTVDVFLAELMREE
ncbi:NUDIX domain-containing protein [Streptomyces hainanensis]|uniref:NUDIX domain-containing protein n=2 Tax=Streptomyces hainanensis TaxID=402648 RepID=A0A4R4TTN3_9ACTN|nr:NUDIX domain-containing protein [Streptomyces hainanensis]